MREREKVVAAAELKLEADKRAHTEHTAKREAVLLEKEEAFRQANPSRNGHQT